MNLIQKILHESSLKEYDDSSPGYFNQTFSFFNRKYDVQKAYDLIKANPNKYKASNGEMYSFDLDTIKKWFSTITPEQDAEMKKGGAFRLTMGVKVDYKTAMEKDEKTLEVPGIWVIDGDFSLLIDGWHRAFARYTKGLSTMEIFVIKDPKDIKEIKIY